MMTFRDRFKRPLVALVAVIVLVTTLASASPLASADPASPAQGIQVSPILINLNANKGQAYKLALKVTNVTDGPLVLTSTVNDFKAKDESGKPKVIINNSGPVGTYSLREWVAPIPQLTLQAHQSAMVNINVSMPANAESGGHYGVIRFSGVPPSQTSQSVALNASVGVLVLARVAGNINEQLNLKQLFAGQSGRQGTVLMGNGPVDLVARIQNIGNVHVEPVGTMAVRNTWGKTVASYPFGSVNENVLPASIRRYSVKFAKPALFGHYTVDLNAAYGTTGGVLIGSASFWIIPVKLILLLIIVIIILIIGGRRTLKRYNERVISRHTRRR